jgi:hypothetical protein
MEDQPPQSMDQARFVSEERERARVLAEVLRDQEERADGARAAEEGRLRRRRFRRGALVATWVGVAYVWIATPSWLRVESPPDPTVEEETKALRVNVFLQTQAIESYRIERGRLPYVLQEAGPPFRGMEYRRRDSRSYDLQGRSDLVTLRYSSEESPFLFVGTAADLLTTPRSR